MNATSAIAGLYGHPLGVNALFPDYSGYDSGYGSESGDESGDESASGDEPGLPPGDTWLGTSDDPAAATSSATSPTGSVTDATSEQMVTGPGGLAVSIPRDWVVGGSPAAANQQAADPSDPRSFVRFGGTTPPGVSLPAEIEAGERTNPNVQNGYQRVQLEEVTFLGSRPSTGSSRSSRTGSPGMRSAGTGGAGGMGYVIYLSAPDARWMALRTVFDRMADTVVIH